MPPGPLNSSTVLSGVTHSGQDMELIANAIAHLAEDGLRIPVLIAGAAPAPHTLQKIVDLPHLLERHHLGVERESPGADHRIPILRNRRNTSGSVRVGGSTCHPHRAARLPKPWISIEVDALDVHTDAPLQPAVRVGDEARLSGPAFIKTRVRPDAATPQNPPVPQPTVAHAASVRMSQSPPRWSRRRRRRSAPPQRDVVFIKPRGRHQVCPRQLPLGAEVDDRRLEIPPSFSCGEACASRRRGTGRLCISESPRRTCRSPRFRNPL